MMGYEGGGGKWLPWQQKTTHVTNSSEIDYVLCDIRVPAIA